MTPDEVALLDTAITVRIDDAAAQADFSSAPLPDFVAVLPDPRRVLDDLVSRAQLRDSTHDRLAEAATDLEHVLDEHHPGDTG